MRCRAVSGWRDVGRQSSHNPLSLNDRREVERRSSVRRKEEKGTGEICISLDRNMWNGVTASSGLRSYLDSASQCKLERWGYDDATRGWCRGGVGWIVLARM